MTDTGFSLVVKSNEFDDVTFSLKPDTHLEKLFM